MENVSNPNDFKVVTFHNSEEFGFTPEMGCMYDGIPIHGRNGLPGIEAGEKKVMPYHVGHQLAINLAKRVFNTSLPATVDEKGNPVGKPIWNATMLQEKAQKYITEMYTEEKPVAQSQTDILMAKMKEFEKMAEQLMSKNELTPEVVTDEVKENVAPKVYLDKQEVIAELEKRGLKFDRRQTKENLEKLLV